VARHDPRSAMPIIPIIADIADTPGTRPHTVTALVLRRRARRLRLIADDLERSALLQHERDEHTTDQHAHQPDQQRGARHIGFGRPIARLHDDQASLHRTAEDLRWQAYLCAQRAEQLAVHEADAERNTESSPRAELRS